MARRRGADGGVRGGHKIFGALFPSDPRSDDSGLDGLALNVGISCGLSLPKIAAKVIGPVCGAIQEDLGRGDFECRLIDHAIQVGVTVHRWTRRCQIGVAPALKPLPASAADTVVGKRAAMDLAAGGLVTAEDVTSAVVPAKGMSLVGVSLPPALMPAAQLQSGDQVRIVATPGAQGDLATGTSPTSIGATVVGVRGAGDNGQIVVDVSVPYDQAAELAARAATGKIALVLDSRER